MKKTLSWILSVIIMLCSFSVTTAALTDTTPPEPPTQMFKKHATGTTMTVAWIASPSEDVVKYVVFDWGSKEVLGETAETELTLTGLTPETTYNLAVCAEDEAGNQSVAHIISDSTADVTPPEPPTQMFRKHATDTTMTVAWTASPSEDVAKYVVFDWDSNEVLGTTEKTEFTLAGLTPGTTYNFAVLAEDKAGNQSPAHVISNSTLSRRLFGDVNDDKRINSRDYVLLKRYCFNTIDLEENDIIVANINGDTNASGFPLVNSRDYILLKRACFETYTIEPKYFLY